MLNGSVDRLAALVLEAARSLGCVDPELSIVFSVLGCEAQILADGTPSDVAVACGFGTTAQRATVDLVDRLAQVRRGRETPCEVCGCTFERACKGGCSWSSPFLARGRYVCTRPRCLRAARPLVQLSFSSRSGRKKGDKSTRLHPEVLGRRPPHRGMSTSSRAGRP